MHSILIKVNPENTAGTVSILQPSGQILQPTAKSGLIVKVKLFHDEKGNWTIRLTVNI
jgi:hypothetical protein